jgi:DnaJ-class molecular chaperone
MAAKTYYEILDVQPTATAEEIKKAARLQRAAWHPDKFSGSSKKLAEERMKEINAAYDELKDPQKRAAYDLM